jgi:hypothetical protein
MKTIYRLSLGIIMILVGIFCFSILLLRFYNQGFFGGEPEILYLISFQMRNWFGSIFYSLLFTLTGLFLVKNRPNIVLYCQFIAVGLILERIWHILGNLNYVDFWSFLIPMLLLLILILYLIFDHLKHNAKKLLIASSIVIINLIIIGIGKFLF